MKSLCLGVHISCFSPLALLLPTRLWPEIDTGGKGVNRLRWDLGGLSHHSSKKRSKGRNKCERPLLRPQGNESAWQQRSSLPPSAIELDGPSKGEHSIAKGALLLAVHQFPSKYSFKSWFERVKLKQNLQLPS